MVLPSYMYLHISRIRAVPRSELYLGNTPSMKTNIRVYGPRPQALLLVEADKRLKTASGSGTLPPSRARSAKAGILQLPYRPLPQFSPKPPTNFLVQSRKESGIGVKGGLPALSCGFVHHSRQLGRRSNGETESGRCRPDWGRERGLQTSEQRAQVRRTRGL